jgi:hypothetical protein
MNCKVIIYGLFNIIITKNKAIIMYGNNTTNQAISG